MRIFAVLALLVTPTLAHADRQWDGYCFQGDECGGPYKIRNGEFSTCESSCKMTNPVKVRGMKAILYDVKCSSDSGNREYRMFMSQGPNNTVVSVREWPGPEILQKCKTSF
jgi:hypothetical protein